MKSHIIIVLHVSSTPPFCITNSDVTKMNAAHPFILMVVQIGSTKRDTRLLTPRCSSDVCMVTGSVAAELLVKSAISTAGIMPRITFTGFMPRDIRNKGSTTKNCNTLPPNITATYLPIDCITIPADTSADNCAAKASMPSGRACISQWMSVDTRFCSPVSPFISVRLPSFSGIRAKAMPTATAISRMERILPSINGCTILAGTMPITYSL